MLITPAQTHSLYVLASRMLFRSMSITPGAPRRRPVPASLVTQGFCLRSGCSSDGNKSTYTAKREAPFAGSRASSRLPFTGEYVWPCYASAGIKCDLVYDGIVPGLTYLASAVRPEFDRAGGVLGREDGRHFSTEFHIPGQVLAPCSAV